MSRKNIRGYRKMENNAIKRGRPIYANRSYMTFWIDFDGQNLFDRYGPRGLVLDFIVYQPDPGKQPTLVGYIF